MAEPTLLPSQIPVSKRRSSGLSFNYGPPSNSPRATSPETALKSPVIGGLSDGYDSQTNGRSVSSTSPGSPTAADAPPVDLQLQVDSLKSSLYASEQRCRDLMSSLASNPSAPSTPLGVPFVSMDKQLPALPHSDASFDLRRRAVETPLAQRKSKRLSGEGKLGLSRIPVSTVNHAIAVHPTPPSDSRNGRLSSQPKSKASSRSNSPLLTSPPSCDSPTPGSRYQDGGFLPRLDVGPNLSLTPPSFRGSESTASSGRRSHASPSTGSSIVIEGLQTDLSRARDHLERLKADLRVSARQVATLTRQSEDLKDTRERMRVECEGLNNVIARKERLLQEVLERARTAESELQVQQATRKTFEKSTQKQIQTMTMQLNDAQLASKKAETECSSMKEGMRSLKDQWAREVKALREEVKVGVERSRKEREEARLKHLALVQMVQTQTAERTKIQLLAQESANQSEAISQKYEAELAALRSQVDSSSKESRETWEAARELAAELSRLRRLMREPGRPDVDLVAGESSG